MDPSYPPAFHPAYNANRMLHAPVPPGFQPMPTHNNMPPPQCPVMIPVHPYPQPQPLQNPAFLPFPFYQPHNFAPPPMRQPFFPVRQLQFVPSPQCSPSVPSSHKVDTDPRPLPTPTTTRNRSSARLHNASLNASLLCGSSSSFSESLRFNPMSQRGRSRDQSLLIDQTVSSSDRSFQSYIDPTEIANNNELIIYCVNELHRKQLTEQELINKVAKSRRFKKFGIHNIPNAISIILNMFPCFTSRTVILKTGPNDLQPVTRTLWKSDRKYMRQRGDKILNATMFEIPERNTGGNEILSVLGDMQSMNLEENRPPTTVASMEQILQGFNL
ncbi:hypothetical protein PFISCL1PPCAC_3843 [Pristionchus fissidentatus]|uniref:Uncharacterized protein n=1 Tax=Pristionchus fissidentatus TaxID=1538716 RepID=A0AAV5V1B1_9BILA|nr:hypothetical protein PFISCL1PPCAC_3843 [Pristionchus fissidentatus]